MKSMVMALAVGSLIAPGAALAAEPEKTLQLRPKAGLMSAMTDVTPVQSHAPFVGPQSSSQFVDPELIFGSRQETAQEATRSSCSGERALCYDSVSGRVVYKPARQFMPAVPGLRPENISIKRNQLVLRYSF
jgi:hypothetical protein